jgi:hypothetical protein
MEPPGTAVRNPLYLCRNPRQRGSVDWLSGNAPSLVVAWPRRTAAEVKVERPQQREDERPWRRRGAAHAWPAREGLLTVNASRSPLTAVVVVVTGLCVRAPSLIWVRGPPRVRRQDDRWGDPCGARPRGLLGPATDQPWRQGARGRWPRHICLPVGRARTSHGQAAAGTGKPRLSTGARAASPSASRVCRHRRASLRATARVARLPPWRALTCW